MRNDLSLYDTLAEQWWDDDAPGFRSLRAVNRHRLEQLGRWLGPDLGRGRVVDLGCGGGLLAVPIAAAGATVVGVDRSRSSLVAAARAAAARGLDRRTAWVEADAARTPLPDGGADLVLLSDVLEHVPDPARLVTEGARLLRPGGLLYASTINRTRRASLLAVHLAEGLRLVPPGTHDPRLFLRPAELTALALDAGLEPLQLAGEGVRLLATLRHRRVEPRPSRSLAVAYGTLFRRARRPDAAIERSVRCGA